MGGYGSGRRSRRPMVEQMTALRVSDLRAALRRVIGGRSEERLHLVFRRGPQPALRICGTFSQLLPDRLNLSLISEPPGCLVSETVALVATCPPLGGPSARRWWFVCPECHRRAAALFFHLERWRCRRCARATYRSSNCSDKRLRPLLRSLAASWLKGAPDPLDALIAELPPLTGGIELSVAQAALHSAQELRIRRRAGQLALARLTRGVPMYRE